MAKAGPRKIYDTARRFITEICKDDDLDGYDVVHVLSGMVGLYSVRDDPVESRNILLEFFSLLSNYPGVPEFMVFPIDEKDKIKH